MVGDRIYDLEAAEENELPFIACKYGYCAPGEFGWLRIYSYEYFGHSSDCRANGNEVIFPFLFPYK